jgi:hypothetical protein
VHSRWRFLLLWTVFLSVWFFSILCFDFENECVSWKSSCNAPILTNKINFEKSIKNNTKSCCHFFLLLRCLFWIQLKTFGLFVWPMDPWMDQKTASEWNGRFFMFRIKSSARCTNVGRHLFFCLHRTLLFTEFCLRLRTKKAFYK